MNNAIDFTKKSLIFITGASKGIGRTIAIETSKLLNENSIIILLARSKNYLKDTESEINRFNKSLRVFTYVADLSKPNIEDYNGIMKEVLGKVEYNDIHNGLIFHNAANSGCLRQTTELTDLSVWREYYDLNLFSVVLLNNAFINNLRSVVQQLMIVNITSYLGHTPLKNTAMYSSAKAARELLFKVLALEEPTTLVLNYSPGPVDTEMFDSMMKNAQSIEVRRKFKVTKETQISTPYATVNKMLDILRKGNFKSGETIENSNTPEL